jgi:hypothetical protein
MPPNARSDGWRGERGLCFRGVEVDGPLDDAGGVASSVGSGFCDVNSWNFMGFRRA